MKPGQVYMTDALSWYQNDVVELTKIFKDQGNWGNIPKVKLFEKNGRYYLIDGNHRVKAARNASLSYLEYDLLSESDVKRYYPNYNTDNIEASAVE